MSEKYDLIDRFPASYPKYELSLIASIVEGGNDIDPCELLYDKNDRHSVESAEEMAERLAFEYTDNLRLLLDVKEFLFKTRTIDETRLAYWLSDNYDYDIAKLKEIKDKKSLFLILIYHTIDFEREKVTKEFHICRAASYKFKDKRNRTTIIDEVESIENLEENIKLYKKEVNKKDLPTVELKHHKSDYYGDLSVIFYREESRKLQPFFEYREENMIKPEEPTLGYYERYPVSENAIRFEYTMDDNIKIYARKSVKSWEDLFIDFFLNVIDRNPVEAIHTRESKKAAEIVQEVQKTSTTNNETSGFDVSNIVKNEVEKAADDVKVNESSNISEENIDNIAERMVVTGIHVDNEDSSFEINSENNVSTLLQQYEGLSKSLTDAIANANSDDVTVYASIPRSNNDDDKIILSDGEWKIGRGSANAKTLNILEKILK